MEDYDIKSRVYVLLDAENRVTRIEGEYSLPADIDGWTLVEEGAPCDRLNLAQSHYLSRPLYTEDGLLAWKYEDGALALRTDEDLEAERAAQPEPETPPTNAELAASLASVQSVSVAAFVALCEAGTLDETTASEHAELFAPWTFPMNYKVGQIRAHGGRLYRCLQDHAAQESWVPDVSPSLWVAISDPAEEWPAWSQPIGSTDAYNAGDKVRHNGKKWTSDMDGNVWEPGVYGWTEYTE